MGLYDLKTTMLPATDSASMTQTLDKAVTVTVAPQEGVYDVFWRSFVMLGKYRTGLFIACDVKRCCYCKISCWQISLNLFWAICSA